VTVPLPPEVPVTCSPTSSVGQDSLRKITPTRAAFARPGPETTPFPDVSARMRPSDSLVPVGRGFGSPRLRPTSMRVLFLAADGCPRKPANVGEGSPDLRGPESFEERRGPPRCLGRPLSCVPWSETPPGATSPRPTSTERLLSPSRLPTPWAPGIGLFSWLPTHGPHVRVPTHRRLRYRNRRKAHYRPGRAHPWPGGFPPAGRRTKFHRASAYSDPLRPALPGRTGGSSCIPRHHPPDNGRSVSLARGVRTGEDEAFKVAGRGAGGCLMRTPRPAHRVRFPAAGSRSGRRGSGWRIDAFLRAER